MDESDQHENEWVDLTEDPTTEELSENNIGCDTSLHQAADSSPSSRLSSLRSFLPSIISDAFTGHRGSNLAATAGGEQINPCRPLPLATQSSKPRKKGPSEAEWEAMKDTIEEHYMNRGLSLNQVVQRLSQHPWNFEATERMYKSRIKKWGLEKNLTKSRLARILAPATSDDGVKEITGIARPSRVEQYIKRTTVDLGCEPMSLQCLRPVDQPCYRVGFEDKLDGVQGDEIESSFPPCNFPATPSFDGDSPCPFLGSGIRKFQLEVEPIWAAIKPWSGILKPFRADSYGDHEYHGLHTRSCDSNCPCRLPPSPSSHVFWVRMSHDSITVTVWGQDLLELVARAGETGAPEFELGTPCSFDGFSLLRNYSRLREVLSEATKTMHRGQTDLSLLINGFLEDRRIWERYGLDKLCSSGVLAEELVRRFRLQQVTRDLDQLDLGVQFADRQVNTQYSGPTPSLGISGFSDGPDSMYAEFLDDDPEENPGWWSNLANFAAGDSFGRTVRVEDTSKGVRSPGAGRNNRKRGAPDELIQASNTGKRKRSSDNPLGSGSNKALIDESGPLHGLAELESEVHVIPHLDIRLVNACTEGNLIAAQDLLTAGANPDAVVDMNSRKCTPLISAAENGHIDLVRLLFKSGASLDQMGTAKRRAGSSCDCSPLLAAVRAGNEEMAQLLLDLGATVEHALAANEGTPSHTALTAAAASRNAELFKLLLFWNTSWSLGLKQFDLLPDRNSQLGRKTDELLTASTQGKTQTAVELLRTGADINAISFRGTALSVAAQAKKPAVVKLLLKHGADVQLAALYLSRTGFEETAKKLVREAYGCQGGFADPRDRFRVLRKRFIKHHERLVAQLGSLTQHKSYRRAWSAGIAAMKAITRGEAPGDVSNVLPLLAIARAVAEMLAGETGDFTLIDKFDQDLPRWIDLFPESDEVSATFRGAVKDLWAVILDDAFFLDTDFLDAEPLARFQELISQLMDQAREPLGLGSGGPRRGGLSLDAALNDWRQRIGLYEGNPSRARTSSPASARRDSQSHTSDWTMFSPPEKPWLPPDSDSPGLRPNLVPLGRRPTQPDPRWPGGDNVPTAFAPREMAECLIRGVIFAFLFCFFQVCQLSSTALLAVVQIRVGTVSERHSNLVRYLEASHRTSQLDEKVQTRCGAADGGIDGNVSVDVEKEEWSNCAKGWYSRLGLNGIWM
ncbi:hypothetical protein QBC47DRAFT_384813 [Echria macrotheca]|uniref:Clr5 domain-containing protein n=1 Tax=Echria macrotheca TaxID=438768 RepID=A0AAJ0F4L7_9PEZI|nr:hypothetical protein QBC47DRAFT_384813 [Echria macrotheca]